MPAIPPESSRMVVSIDLRDVMAVVGVATIVAGGFWLHPAVGTMLLGGGAVGAALYLAKPRG